MKIQDVGFIVIFLVLFAFIRKPKWFAAAGLICLGLSIPLFGFWIFFSAQRLVYYAAAFFTAAIFLTLILNRNK